MTAPFKPMLAVDFVEEKLTFPKYISPKLDGIRAINIGGVLFSRSMKPIPNQHVQELFSLYYGLDGELICGDPTSPTCYRDTNSAVMSKSGTPDVKFYVFDHIDHLDEPFKARISHVDRAVEEAGDENLKLVPHLNVGSVLEMNAIEEAYLAQGYEGAMLRDPNAPYKQGRSTVKEGFLLKVKRFVDGEYEVIGFEEQMHNTNEATKNELGRTKRSSHKSGMVGKDTLGAILGRDVKSGVEFNVGTGFDDKTRKEIWENRPSYLGTFRKYKSFMIGVKDKPRFPVDLGPRDPIDMVTE